jgi:hypothetical protein
MNVSRQLYRIPSGSSARKIASTNAVLSGLTICLIHSISQAFYTLKERGFNLADMLTVQPAIDDWPETMENT